MYSIFRAKKGACAPRSSPSNPPLWCTIATFWSLPGRIIRPQILLNFSHWLGHYCLRWTAVSSCAISALDFGVLHLYAISLRSVSSCSDVCVQSLSGVQFQPLTGWLRLMLANLVMTTSLLYWLPLYLHLLESDIKLYHLEATCSCFCYQLELVCLCPKVSFTTLFIMRSDKNSIFSHITYC